MTSPYHSRRSLKIFLDTLGSDVHISSQPVIDAAMQVEKAIIDVYLGPNRTVREIIEIARDEESRGSPVFTFSAACRIDLFERATKRH